MRALTISAHGSLEQIAYRTDVPVPEPGADEVRIRVAAAALNRLDLFVVGGLPGVTITPPWVLGADAMGYVDAFGPATRPSELAEGDRVIVNPGVSDGTCEYCRSDRQPLCPRFGILGEHRPGTLAEYVVVPARNVRKIPHAIPGPSAAAFTLATLTAWRMVVTRAAVEPDELVLVQGIGGGVALAALQIARLRGARVWVTSGSDAKLARAATLGAEVGLNHRSVDVAAEVRARTGKRGVDVVIDDVGTATWTTSLGALGRGGRLVTCGGTSGPMVETDVRRLFWNQWSILGSTMGSDGEFDAIADELRQGRLLPLVDSVVPLEQGRVALERLQRGEQFGKIVIAVGEDAA